MSEQYCSVRISGSAVSFGAVSLTAARRKRGAIQRFSTKSRARLLRYLADCRASYQFFGTLTVGAQWELDGRLFKLAIDSYLSWFLRTMRAGSSYPNDSSICWFLEFQARGAPHLHFFYTDWIDWRDAAPKWRSCLEQFGASSTAGVEEAGTKFEVLRKGRAGTIGYARKYASKVAQKDVPEAYQHVGRFWGVRGLRACDSYHALVAYEQGGQKLLNLILELLKRYRDTGSFRVFRWQEQRGFLLARKLDNNPAAWFEFSYELHKLVRAHGLKWGWYDSAAA